MCYLFVFSYYFIFFFMSLLVMVFCVHAFACGNVHNGVLSPLLVFLFIRLLPIMFSFLACVFACGYL
jgi:hypothetical protein